MSDVKLSEKVAASGLASEAQINDVLAAIRGTGDVFLDFNLIKALLLQVLATSSGLKVSGPNKILGRVTSGEGAIEEITASSKARELLDDADVSAMLQTLELTYDKGRALILPQTNKFRWIEQTVFNRQAIPQGFTVNASGTGAAVTLTNTTIRGRLGCCVAALETGTTATGRASVHDGVGAESIQFGITPIRQAFLIDIPDLATLSEKYVFYIGYADNQNGAGRPVDGAYFIYDLDTSINWYRGVASNSVRTEQDTTIEVATGINLLEVYVDTTPTAYFFINGVAAGSISSGLPTGSSRLTLRCMKIEKTSGTTNRIIGVISSVTKAEAA